MNDKPLISIITPSLNSGIFIKEAINSVSAQTYKNWELLIVDGGSTDDTIKIIKKYADQDPRIKLIENLNDRGTSQARSFGIKKSKGDYLAFIDSDDIWF